MLILVTYDVETLTKEGQKRLRTVARICMDYGLRVQNSVFECNVDQSQFIKLKHLIERAIDMKKDSIRFYHLGNNWQGKVECLGKSVGVNVVEGELII